MADRPTPYSIAICTLIALQSDPTSPLHQEFHPSPEAQQCLSSFLEERVSLSPLHGLSSVAEGLPGRSSMINAVSMSDFFSQLKSAAGKNKQMESLCNLLLDYVSMAASSVDGLVDLMQSLRHAVLEGIVDSNSAHGVFLRKVCLGFDLLSFETVSLLWSDMQQEIKFAKHSLDGEGSMNAPPGNDETKTNELLETTGDTPWPLSSAQIEGALRKECFRMMETKSDNPGEKIFSYEEVEVNLRYVLSLDPELPAAHFLRFLNCIKHGERVGAMDALHRYFDYAIIQGDNNSTGARGSDTLQFAAILLAASHHSFGDSALAKLATDEAVKVAQQSMDASCVAFALGWIFNTNQNGGQSGENSGVSPGLTMTTPQAGDLLLRCATRAMEAHMPSLAAGSNLTKTRYHLLDSAPRQSPIGNNRNNQGFAEVAWNCLADASSQNGTEVSDDGAVDRPTHVTDASNYRDVMTILARQSLVSGGVWDYFGQRHLSGLSSFVALYCHGNNQMLSHDVINAIQNISRVSLFGSPTALVTNAFKGKALEEIMLDSDSSAAQVTSCVYSGALIKLISCWKQFSLPMDAIFLLSATTVLQEWAVRRGELNQALAFGSALQGFLHPRIYNYWQVMIDIMSVKSLMLARQEKWEEAQELLLATIQTAKVNQLRPQHASLLLQLSLVHLDENPLNFTLALPTLLECLTMTDQYKMDGLHACALSVLAQVHFRMKNATRAIALLKAALPSILQTEHVWYQGEAFLTLAKCRMQLAGICFQSDGLKSVTTNKQALMRLFRSTVRDLRQSQHFFEKCQDLARLQEVFYLQARVLDKMPREHHQRDGAAQAFLSVSQYLSAADKPRAGDDGVLNCLSSMDALQKLTDRPIPAQVE